MRRRQFTLWGVLALLVTACAGGGGATTTAEAAESTTSAPAATQPPPTTTTPMTAPPETSGPTTTEPATAAALVIEGATVTVSWDDLPSTPYFAPAAGGADPFFHIHTNPDEDGFFLSFEMYTTGYGQQWTGETGTFDISCTDAVNSTGICPYFDPDGAGPEAVKGDDFAATGSLTIARLDDGGYEITVHELVFSDGTTFNEFVMTG